MTAEFAELEERIAIDRDALDEEIVSFTSFFFHVGQGYAQAVAMRDAAKEDVSVYEANLSREVRAAAVNSGDKLTEAAITARVTADDGRVELYERYIQAKLTAERWNVLRDSWQQKGHMLRELVELHKINYFGDRPVMATDRYEAGDRIRTRATT